MRYNHPYFKKINRNEETNTPPIQNENSELISANRRNCSGYSFGDYMPATVSVDDPRWVCGYCTQAKINVTSENFKNSLDGLAGRYAGYSVNDIGDILPAEAPYDANNGIMMAMPFTLLEEENKFVVGHSCIVNTENAGLRHVEVDPIGFIHDYAPVEEACIIGNRNRAEGIYVPLSNTKAMVDAAYLLNTIIEKDIPADDDEVEDA